MDKMNHLPPGFRMEWDGSDGVNVLFSVPDDGDYQTVILGFPTVPDAVVGAWEAYEREVRSGVLDVGDGDRQQAV